MDFNLKNYQNIKLKNFFKTNSLVFWFHSAKLDSNQWIYIEQNLKKLKLHHLKISNHITSKRLKNSIFTNLSVVVHSFILLVSSNFKKTELMFNSIRKSFQHPFELILIKLNNKIYSTSELKGLKNFSYKKNVFNLYKSLDHHLKKKLFVLAKK